ncbi:MAG: DUF2961 domain-containing protein, partial [Acidobacteria bacterium]|nr:DUF2961 domain-containing protein [Acidobacteriota bacterium]
PLPELFGSGHAPFRPPLVGDRMASSGGNFSYVPIAYRDGCRVTLVGAQDARIWFQINYHRLQSAEGLATFDGEEDLGGLEALLRKPGRDPWRGRWFRPIGSSTTGEVELLPGESTVLFEEEGSGLLTGLWLDAPEPSWDELRLTLTFDETTTADLLLRDFFAIGRGGALPTRSLLLGLDKTGSLYSFFPMPYFRQVEVRLTRIRSEGESTTPIAYRVRRGEQEPAMDSGLFGAQLSVADPTVPGSDIPLLELFGEGKWVGLFSELASVDTRSGLYLEGDERVYLDGSATPTLHGTGTEDLFNGGFYFDQGPFRHSLHGMAYQVKTSISSVTGAYRFFLSDAVVFDTRIHAELEAGPTGGLPMRARTVSYYYLRPGTG